MKYQFIDEYGSFQVDDAEENQGLYFPLANEAGLKSAVTPNLGGDSKLDQNHFLLEPTSIENLNNNRSTRNFWCIINGNIAWSATGASAEQELMRFYANKEQSYVRAGYMWHEIGRVNKALGIKSEITSFVPVNDNVEIMQVKITNISAKNMQIKAVAAIPIFGRSADNIRDHRHVTSLLHRAEVTEYGIRVRPTLSFDERGHQLCDTEYFVEGVDKDLNGPVGCYPELAAFIGAGGTMTHPQCIYKREEAKLLRKGDKVNGQEIMGALEFSETLLLPSETAEFTILLGASDTKDYRDMSSPYFKKGQVNKALEVTKKYWKDKVNISIHTGDKNFDQFVSWVTFQPELRRLYGCSFLPHHDYGKGGRGWRDLWQDCLALLIMNPDGVREMLVANFAGVRIDGSNATIIGSKLGEFKADRNSITRVWSDHGIWPVVTTALYIDQTRDYDILYENAKYFKDRQVLRGREVDHKWQPDMTWQQDENGNEIETSLLEHMILQQLTSFYEVGDHGNMLLRDADWNDAIDMAGEKGETVAFTCALAMNLDTLAKILEHEKDRGVREVEILSEIVNLIEAKIDEKNIIASKRNILDSYMKSCMHTVEGIREHIEINTLIRSLKTKSEWIKNHIRENEWVGDEKNLRWFNSYYDNHGNQVEGNDRMMLTGQVFAIMSSVAENEQIQDIVRAADEYLYDEKCGGYRLNTDFNELKTDMGRMFGFAYGEKENGAVFSHMAVMYANALYQRGYAKAGFKSLNALYKASMNMEKSRIYPGIPEYFGKDGRGLYHYLTGAASWYMMTVVTQMFGVRGERGNLIIAPQLLREQFDANNKAEISMRFMDRDFVIEIANPYKFEVGEYQIARAVLDGVKLGIAKPQKLEIDQKLIVDMDKTTHHIQITLG